MSEVIQILKNKQYSYYTKLIANEYHNCIDELKKAYMKKQKSLTYLVPLRMPSCPDWDVKIVCYKLLEKLRLEHIRVLYRSPNKLLIIVPKTRAKIVPDKDLIYKKMLEENSKSYDLLE